MKSFKDIIAEARMVATGDYRISASGRKVRRLIKIGDDDYNKADDIDKDGDVDADDKKAMKMRGESVEQIDEISDKTLGNYINAARKDREHNKINKAAPDTAQRAHANERDKKRIAGMNKAKSYLTPGTAGHAKNQARRAANEEVVVESTEKPPFDPPYKKSQDVVTDKSGAKHTPMSRARDLARQAIKKQIDKNKTSMKEEKSRKAQIIKDVTKKKDKFESDPIITDTTVKTDDLR